MTKPDQAAPKETPRDTRQADSVTFWRNRAENLACALTAAQARVKELEWIPVSKRLPEDGVSVLCRCQHTRDGAWFTACGHIQGTFASVPAWRVPGFNNDFGRINGTVTHWMPLPAAPADGRDEG